LETRCMVKTYCAIRRPANFEDAHCSSCWR
jgi:hypothetical protein